MDAFGRRSRPASYPSSSSSRWSGSASGWARESSTCTSAGPDVAPAQPARREDTSTHVTEKLAQPTGDFLDAFGDVSAAVESGAGLPEVARSRAPERASEAAVSSFVSDLLDRRVTDRDNILARANELGADLSDGAGVVVARAHPQVPEEGDWRARVLAIVERTARAASPVSLPAAVEISAARSPHASGEDSRELVVVVPATDSELPRRAAEAIHRELQRGLPGYDITVAVSRPAGDPVDVPRAGVEAVLAANVAEAERKGFLAFEETGSYRLLLPVLTDDPAELQRFHEETISPLVAYDEQYDTELVRTLETFPDEDGSVARTAAGPYTHPHTIRYRLERVRELTGLDVGSTDGRERLSLGLKAMRVLGIMPPRGPASEPGAEAGQVPPEEPDR